METAARDWSALPVDVLLISMSSMEVPDVVHSGAVCTTWRSAYAAFRALRLPTPRQPPCLLYHARDAVDGPAGGATRLYSPSTDATYRMRLQDPSGGVICSARGWLFATDEVANPYLLNQITGARAAIPPITTLDRVKGSSFLDDGGVVYDVNHEWGPGPAGMRQVTAQRARDWMYRRVAISASPGGGAAACVVLLVHMPYAELSFARPGDCRWTSVSNCIPAFHRGDFSSVVYDEKDGLLYLLQDTGAVHALDLNGISPVMRLVSCTLTSYASKCTPYLVRTPCGDLLVVTRRWCRSGESPAEVSRRRDRIRNGGEVYAEEHKYVTTTDVQLHKIDTVRYRLEKLAGPADHALFLGRNSALYLPIECLPMPLSKGDCAYLTDDVDSDTFHSPMSRRDVSMWDFGSGSMHKLHDLWPVQPWLDTPATIWITPSRS